MTRPRTLVGIAAAGLMIGLPVAGLPAVVAGAPAAFAQPSCADSWNNAAGGTWATASDWSTGAPPTSSQAACITISLSAPVVLSGAATAASLTLGGTSGSADLELDGGTLSLASASNVARSGEVSAAGGGGTIEVAAPAVLTNDGVVDTSGSNVFFSGDVTNAADGWVDVTGSTLGIDTGTFTNSGEVSVQTNGTLEAPANGNVGAVIDNAGGAIQNQGVVGVDKGGTFEQGSGEVIGAPAQVGYGGGTSKGALDLAGTGPGTFELEGGSTLSGDVASGQTLLLDGNVATSGALTNGGAITLAGSSTLTPPEGETITNAGSVVVADGGALQLAGDLDNQTAGSITVANGTLDVDGSVTITNDGTISVGTSGTLNANSASTIDNAGGAIADGGTVTVESGATFVEAKGTTTGRAIQVDGALDLTGKGASSFEVSGASAHTASMSGNVAAKQTVWVAGVNATASFTNDGTMFFIGTTAGALNLPSGDTLTNDGTMEADGGMAFDGNLTNSPGGVISEESNIAMDGVGTTFDNEGTLDLLFGGGMDLSECGCTSNNTFDNTGTIYWGVDSSGAEWGGSGSASNINAGTGASAVLGGTIVPVTEGEPSGGSGSQIAYGLGSVSSCPASVTSGWTIGCAKGNGELYEPESSTLEPTEVSVSGSGTSGQYGWTSTYGQPVTLTATVSAADGSTPTGKVAFYAVQDNSSGAIPADLLGTQTLSTTGGTTTATLTFNPPPGNYDLIAWYQGDSTHLEASMSSLSACDCTQTVDQRTTTVSVGSSTSSAVFGTPVTLTATVTPAAYGPANPSGVVTFFDGITPIGSASVTTTSGVTTATLTTSDLPVGSDSINASYSGDLYYGSSSTTSAYSQSVTAPSGPGTVTVMGPTTVAPGAAYKATATTDGTGAVWFALSSAPAPPTGMKIGGTTGKVTYTVPSSGTSSFSYAVVASNAAGQAQSSIVTVQVS